MTTTVSNILEARLAAQDSGSFRRAVYYAGGLHLALVAAAWLVPILLAEPPQPIEFVAVRIIPAAQLGVAKPKAAPPAKAPAKPEAAAPTAVESKAPVLRPAKPKPEKARPAAEPTQPAQAQPDSTSVAAERQGVASGSLAGMALGAPTATFDAPDFTYGYYVDQMLSQISSNWTRPLVGGGVEAWLHFEIARDGNISSIRINRSSGINSFDLAALRAVQASSPLPPLPRAFRESSLGVNLIVR